MWGFFWWDDAVEFARRCATRQGIRWRVYRSAGPLAIWRAEPW